MRHIAIGTGDINSDGPAHERYRNITWRYYESSAPLDHDISMLLVVPGLTEPLAESSWVYSESITAEDTIDVNTPSRERGRARACCDVRRRAGGRSHYQDVGIVAGTEKSSHAKKHKCLL